MTDRISHLMRWLLSAFLACMLLPVDIASAHELRPAYLELRERSDGEFVVMWKTPMRGDLRLSLWPELSGQVEPTTDITSIRSNDAAVQKWRIRANEPLRGQTISIAGLSGTMTDAMVRIEFADGSTWVKRLVPSDPSATIPVSHSTFTVASVYFVLGVEHILTGIDHLLFVLALIIITRLGWKLVKTVTAFTIAHSVTLTAATLGWVHVPTRPVEAIIALSIVFVAIEIVRQYRGQASLAARSPWLVAFAFGLLHGLGFAGGLSDIGLPVGHIPAALLFFSVGVETGHLLFVAAVLALVAIGRRMKRPLPSWAELVPPYAIGSIAMFWVIQRIAPF